MKHSRHWILALCALIVAQVTTAPNAFAQHPDQQTTRSTRIDSYDHCHFDTDHGHQHCYAAGEPHACDLQTSRHASPVYVEVHQAQPRIIYQTRPSHRWRDYRYHGKGNNAYYSHYYRSRNRFDHPDKYHSNRRHYKNHRHARCHHTNRHYRQDLRHRQQGFYLRFRDNDKQHRKGTERGHHDKHRDRHHRTSSQRELTIGLH